MSSENLPSNIFFEILSRTTLETLDICKRVSQEWNQLIYEPTFMPKYCQRTKSISGFVIQTTNFPYDYVSKFIDHSTTNSFDGLLPSNAKILASCDQGILCYVRWSKDYYRQHYICKPSTRQWQSLPYPEVKYKTVKMAMVVFGLNPLRYKIVRILENYFYKSWKDHKYHCEIFDSTCWRWRETQNFSLITQRDELIVDSTPSIYANNSFHWKTVKGDIIAFHEPTESFHTFQLPELDHDNRSHGVLVDYKGKLGFCYKKETKVELWLSKGNFIQKRVQWHKHMAIDIGGLGEKAKDLVPVGFDYGGVLSLSSSQIFLYQGQGSNFSVIDLDPSFYHPKKIWKNRIFQLRSHFKTIILKTTAPN